jgi:H+/Cl- antiporter ClcA
VSSHSEADHLTTPGDASPDPPVATAPAEAAQDPVAVLRSPQYVSLLVIAAVIGLPISAVAYFFLVLVAHLQGWLYTDLPHGLGFPDVPVWWPAPLLVVGGLLVALTIKYLPGKGGESPADGFHPGGPPDPSHLPGIALAALATLSFGAVLGPEAPLIAIGGALGALVIRLAKRDAPARTIAVVGATGSFAAISTLLGSPLIGAFLLMEASGLGGAMASVVLLPGLLAAGIGALIFIGLDSLTGLGAASLSIPGLAPFAHPDIVQFLWALVIGVAAAFVGTAIRRLALRLRSAAGSRLLVTVPLAGLVVAGLAIGYQELTDKPSADVLFSGQDDLGSLISNAAGYSVVALVLLVLCKALAYAVSLSSFRGGPIFPAMFIGVAGGLALSHLPGLPLVPGIAMGIGAMSATMLRLPLVSVLLATLLLGTDGLAVMPVVIVAVVVAHVVTARITPLPAGRRAVPAPG